ncbi:hypothetical protein U0070_005270 [Myodes glareolus]|uniref:Protein FAM162A n=1 Tax=Myodes glareolus TaxID=447135 RepID=A0AAW0GVS4_MYOGA
MHSCNIPAVLVFKLLLRYRKKRAKHICSFYCWFEMFDAAKNKLWVKVSYLMIALTMTEYIYMVIEDKKVARRHESLTILNLEKKASLREEAAMKAKTK